MPPFIHTMRHCLLQAQFLFFGEADFLFSSIPPSPQPQKPISAIASIASIASIHPKTSNILFWSCLLCTPSLTLPPSSLKCLQKSNPGIHRECFKCFRCFKCFVSLLDHKTARFWSKSEQNKCFKCSTSLLPSLQGGGGGRLLRSATNPHLQSRK